MAVKRLLIVWMLLLFSTAQDTLSHQSNVPGKTQEDADNGQISHIQKANNNDLHDNSKQPAGATVRLSGDQDDHLAADLLLEHPSPLSGTEQDNSNDYPQSHAASSMSANSNRFSFDAPMYEDFFSANAHGPGSINAGISNVPSLNSSLSDVVILQPAFLPEGTKEILANNGDVENLVAIIPLPAFEESDSQHVKYDLENLRFPETDSPMQEYDLPWLPYITDLNQQKLWYYDLYNGGHSVNEESYKPVSMKEDKDKRKFDSISGISSFGGLGKRVDKRKFDSISGSSSFGRFGKRQDKRKFDSISGSSSFGRFGKRQEKRKFDSISGSSSFGRFGKRQEKRKFDSISGSSSFGRFGKRQDKRKFDSISDVSSFGGFGKRLNKRKLDSISDISSFGGFGKRSDKRTFDPISEVRPLERLSKRSAHEKEISYSNFEDAKVGQKRKFDSISGVSSFGNFGKRQMGDKENFLPTSEVSSYGAVDKRLGEDKRRFDSISGTSSFGRFGKRQTQANRQLDTIPDVAPFDRLDKRAFDSISGFSSFGGLGKRLPKQKRRFDSISLASSFGEFGRNGRTGKRKFDSISQASSFGRFNKRQNDDRATFESISGYIPFGKFGAVNRELYFNPVISSFENDGENTAKISHQISNLEDKSAMKYRHRRAVSDMYTQEKIRQPNDDHRGDKYNNIYALFNDRGNMDQADEELNFNSNNQDSEDMNAWRTNSYGNDNILDNIPALYGEELPGFYDNEPIPFNKRKFVRIGSNGAFGVPGKRTVVRHQMKEKHMQYRQSVVDLSKRRFDRISNQGSVFRSFGRRSLAL